MEFEPEVPPLAERKFREPVNVTVEVRSVLYLNHMARKFGGLVWDLEKKEFQFVKPGHGWWRRSEDRVEFWVEIGHCLCVRLADQIGERVHIWHPVSGVQFGHIYVFTPLPPPLRAHLEALRDQGCKSSGCACKAEIEAALALSHAKAK